MMVAGLRYDTSPRGEWINQGRGPRWRYTVRTGAGFAVRHYPGPLERRRAGSSVRTRSQIRRPC